MDRKDSASATKTVIATPIVDCSYFKLAQSCGAHNAWFDSDVEIGVRKYRRRVFLQDFTDSLEFGMSCALLNSC